MKYIRTKEGIIDLGKISLPYLIVDKYMDFNSQGRFEIIKQADSIEELCDEFVIIYKNGYINQFKANQMANDVQTTNEFVKENYLRFHKEGHIANVYGAIWTDKGLVYVIKMNEKGEFELL